MLSADKVLRDAFEKKIKASNEEFPASMFKLNERTGHYYSPGLEHRFEDFCAGAKWFSDECNKLNAISYFKGHGNAL